MSHYLPLITRADPERAPNAARPGVPASDKLVSLFEPHTDIIVKGARTVIRPQAQPGHRQSGLILDIVIEAGNPADAERFLPMLDRHIDRCEVPRQMAADGLCQPRQPR